MAGKYAHFDSLDPPQNDPPPDWWFCAVPKPDVITEQVFTTWIGHVTQHGNDGQSVAELLDHGKRIV